MNIKNMNIKVSLTIFIITIYMKKGYFKQFNYLKSEFMFSVIT